LCAEQVRGAEEADEDSKEVHRDGVGIYTGIDS